MDRLVESEYSEVPGPHKSGLRRELVRVYRGRFCFNLGAGIRCGGAKSFTITKGEKRTLQLNLGLTVPVPGAPSLGLGSTIEYEHTFSDEIGPWPLDKCDSIFPVLCYDEAEVKIFRSRRPIRKYVLSAYTEQFLPRPGDYGWAHPNALYNDPMCPCHDGGVPSGIRQADPRTVEQAPSMSLLRLIALQALELSRDRSYDAAEEAAIAVSDILASDDEPTETQPQLGIVRADGVPVWLAGEQPVDGPSVVLLPWGVSSMSRGINTFDTELIPLIAITRPDVAATCDITVLARAPGEDTLSAMAQESVPVQTGGRVAAAWYELDFADVEPGTSGIIELEMRGSDGATVGYPAREGFSVDPLATVTKPQPA